MGSKETLAANEEVEKYLTVTRIRKHYSTTQIINHIFGDFAHFGFQTNKYMPQTKSAVR